MLIDLLTGQVSPMEILIRVFCVLLCITVHEVAHGYAAYKLGDNTAKNMGRLTLNPIPHIDIVGGLAMLFAGFGWAKPVPVEPRNFTRKISMRNGMALTAFAGPLSNLIFAFIVMIIMFALRSFGVLEFLAIGGHFWMIPAPGTVHGTLMSIFITLIAMNLGLAIFNLIPVPPLDGSWILSAWLPNRLLFKYARIERVGFIVLIALLFLTPFGTFLGMIIRYIQMFYMWVIQLIPFF